MRRGKRDKEIKPVVLPRPASVIIANDRRMCNFFLSKMWKMVSLVTIHSRFRIDNRCVVLARKHLLSILKPDCEAVTPPT